MERIKVLFVDDDVTLGKIVTLALDESGYETHYQSSLIAIHSVILELNPDIIILDVEIGNKNGIEITPELKAIVPNTPILFVSSHVDSSDVVKALNAGAIAYLKKPFDIEELLAYINRHTNTFHSDGIIIGNFKLNTDDDTLLFNDKKVKRLSKLEGKLLKLLASNRNQTVTREQIETELWEGCINSEQSLNNFIAKLRKYLSEDEQLELVTIPKKGYKLIVQG